MAQPARYLFDLDFSAPPEPEIEEVVEEEIIEEEPPEPMITVAEHEMLIETIRQQAYEQGLAEGRQEREQTALEKSIDLQKSILDEIAMVYTEVGTLLSRLERDASKLAFSFASRFAEKLVAQEPKAEIQALLNQILAPLRKTPHLTIRIHPDLADEIRQSTEEQMKELGFAGSLLIKGDDAIAPGDCELEWNDGGIGRNMRAAIHQAEALLEQHFAHIPEDEMSDDMDDEMQDETENAEGSSEEPATEPDPSPDEPAPEEMATEMSAEADDPVPDPSLSTEAMPDADFDNQPHQPQGEPQ